jgi:uncharacterized MAPEG superfamily protein
MTIAFWCVLVAAVMPLALALTSKLGDKTFNNRSPRAWYDTLSGYRQRAAWAQANSHEIFPVFAAAVIIAHITGGAEQSLIDLYAMVFIASRFAFAGFYLADRHLARSLAWTLGVLCIIGLFVSAV